MYVKLPIGSGLSVRTDSFHAADDLPAQSFYCVVGSIVIFTPLPSPAGLPSHLGSHPFAWF